MSTKHMKCVVVSKPLRICHFTASSIHTSLRFLSCSHHRPAPVPCPLLQEGVFGWRVLLNAHSLPCTMSTDTRVGDSPRDDCATPRSGGSAQCGPECTCEDCIMTTLRRNVSTHQGGIEECNCSQCEEDSQAGGTESDSMSMSGNQSDGDLWSKSREHVQFLEDDVVGPTPVNRKCSAPDQHVNDLIARGGTQRAKSASAIFDAPPPLEAGSPGQRRKWLVRALRRPFEAHKGRKWKRKQRREKRRQQIEDLWVNLEFEESCGGTSSFGMISRTDVSSVTELDVDYEHEKYDAAPCAELSSISQELVELPVDADQSGVRYCNSDVQVVEFPNPMTTIASEDEWRAYELWKNQVLKTTHSAQQALGRSPRSDLQRCGLRMCAFLFFYRLEIPIHMIAPEYLRTEEEWAVHNRMPLSHASTLPVPLTMPKFVENARNSAEPQKFVSIPMELQNAELQESDDGVSLFKNARWWCMPLDGQLCFDYEISASDYELLFGERSARSKVYHYLQTMETTRKLRSGALQKKELYSLLTHSHEVELLRTTDPALFKKRDLYIKWILRWIQTNRKAVVLNACKALVSITYPTEIVPGLSDKLWESGAIHRILLFARRGLLNVHNEVKLSDIKLEHQMGQGGTARVFLGEWNGTSCAVKTCNSQSPAWDEEEFRYEVALLSVLSHPNLLHSRGAQIGPSKFFMLLPVQARGSLEDVLSNEAVRIPWELRVRFAIDIASGMEYLHEHKIVHLDLKTENVLLSEDWNATIADFGTSRGIHKKVDGRLSEGLIGTTPYMAPEMFEEEPARITEKADVYSFAIVLSQLLTRRYPFFHDGVKPFLIPGMVMEGKRPTIVTDLPESAASKALLSLCRLCWNQTPSKRPSFAAIHQKLRAIDEKLGEAGC